MDTLSPTVRFGEVECPHLMVAKINIENVLSLGAWPNSYDVSRQGLGNSKGLFSEAKLAFVRFDQNIVRSIFRLW
ncbi:hypothetical protein D3C75_1210520 [compost metagenome]